jgi:hypothetical protein
MAGVKGGWKYTGVITEITVTLETDGDKKNSLKFESVTVMPTLVIRIRMFNINKRTL